MGDLWIPDVDDWLRSAGCDVVEFNGGRTGNWRTLSRSSGGYDDIYALGPHHDASAIGRTGQRAAEAHFREHQFAPVGALALDRDGVWWVGAAGATNTQGKGGPYLCSRGTIPLDAGNRYMISIEAANNGVGEIWPTDQLDAYARGIAAIYRGLAEQGAYNARLRRYQPIVLDPLTDTVAHFEWAPTRKIDPAGGRGQYPYGEQNDRYMRWDMARFRADIAARLRDPEEWNMQIHRETVLDTRPNPVGLGHHGGQPVKVGEEVKIIVPARSQAFVRIEVIGPRYPGYLSFDNGAQASANWAGGETIVTQLDQIPVSGKVAKVTLHGDPRTTAHVKIATRSID